MPSDQACIESYSKHEQLFAAADELGMPWQSLYYRLRKLGHPVAGNKSKWGSKTDRFAAKGEEKFLELVPTADNSNLKQYQSKIDFIVNGVKVDVKSARMKRSNGKYASLRWAFYLKKQLEHADFYVCLGFDEDGDELKTCYLIPRDMISAITTLSIPCSGASKWESFSVNPRDLSLFFSELSE